MSHEGLQGHAHSMDVESVAANVHSGELLTAAQYLGQYLQRAHGACKKFRLKSGTVGWLFSGIRAAPVTVAEANAERIGRATMAAIHASEKALRECATLTQALTDAERCVTEAYVALTAAEAQQTTAAASHAAARATLEQAQTTCANITRDIQCASESGAENQAALRQARTTMARCQRITAALASLRTDDMQEHIQTLEATFSTSGAVHTSSDSVTDRLDNLRVVAVSAAKEGALIAKDIPHLEEEVQRRCAAEADAARVMDRLLSEERIAAEAAKVAEQTAERSHRDLRDAEAAVSNLETELRGHQEQLTMLQGQWQQAVDTSDAYLARVRQCVAKLQEAAAEGDDDKLVAWFLSPSFDTEWASVAAMRSPVASPKTP